MTNDGVAKVQHYVPQFLLRNFGSGKKDKLHVFDKQTGKSFATNAKNIAAESRFYDFRLEGQDLTIETELSKMEGGAKPVVKSILDSDSLGDLAAEDRTTLSVFMAVQMVRGKWYREQFREMPKLLEQALRAKDGEGADLSGIAEYVQVPDENEQAIHTARSFLRAARDFASHFADKVWALGATRPTHPFQLGDNPIGLQNMIDMGPYGNIGLAVRGIEMYFPLSPRRILTMWCPSHVPAFRASALRDGPSSGAGQVLAAIESGRSFEYKAEHVMNANSLQVRHAERFVFSCNGDFSLARKMIEDHEVYRKGPRPTIN